MLVSYFFLFTTALSIMIHKELGTIYLTEGEPYELYLSDYFSGNNLSFEISDSNATTGSAILENKCEFEMLSFLPYQNTSWNETWTHSNLKPLLSWKPSLSNEVFIWYNLKYIAFYSFTSEQGGIEMFWNGFIDSQYLNSCIQDITIYQNYYRDIIYALIWVKQQENTNLWRNDFYYINLSNLSALENPKWLNFSEATYASNIVLTHGTIDEIFPIYFEFSSLPSAIYIYKITNIEEPILYQVISKYYGIPISKMSVVSMEMSSSYLYVLDTNFGVIEYNLFGIWNLYFKQSERNYYGYLGTLNSMWEFYNGMSGIISSSGVLIFEASLYQKELDFLEGKGMDWEKGCLQLKEDYYFIQSSNGVLSVALSWMQPLQILYNINISDLVGKSFKATGQWGFLIYDKIFYLRFDMDGLRVYKVYLEEWSMKIWGNSTFYIKIAAKDQNNSIISSTLHVNSIPQNSQEIFQIDMYWPISISPLELIADVKDGTYFSIILNDYFSGPNLEYAVANLPDLKNVTFEIISMNKLKLYQNISLSNNITNFLIYGWYLVSFYDSQVMIDWNGINTIIDIINPIKFAQNEGYAIYSNPSQNSFLISIYDSLADHLQEIRSEIDCLFFLFDSLYLICANSNQIGIYLDNSTYYHFATLIGTQFENASQWNITDLTIYSSSNGVLYIYIIDNQLGTVVIDLSSIINKAQPYDYYGKVSGARRVISTKKEICLVFENFIEIYEYPLNYWKTILTNIYEPVVGAYGMFNMIYLTTSNTLYIFDSDQPSHNSLFYELSISNTSLLSFGLFGLGDMRIANFNRIEHYVEIYTSSCPNREDHKGCSFSFEICMLIDGSEYLRDYYLQTSVSIVAFNNESLLTETFPVNLIINGELPWYRDEKWENNKNIPYNERYELDLSEFFFGQNILMTLSVNGNYSFNETIENWPAVIPQRAELLGRWSLNSNHGRANHIIIPNTEIAVILYGFELFVIEAFGFSNKAVVLNLTEISNITQLKCNFMDVFPYTQNNLTLLISSCSYIVQQEILNTTTITYLSEIVYAIILWEFDYINFEVTHYELLNVFSDAIILKVAPLDSHNFEILAFYIDIESENSKNDIYRFRGRWEKNSICINQFEIINYFSLGLNVFYALIVDFKVKDSEAAYWYILDSQYGIRIIKTSEKSSSILVGGLPIESQNFGLCGDTFYIISEKWMKSFKLKAYTRLEEDLHYSLHESSEFDYFYMLNPVVCSSDTRYIACPFWNNKATLLIRIWDTKAKNSSSIISEIYVSNVLTLIYPVSMQFIGNSILTFYNAYGNEYQNYKINENYLIFPKMSKEEYEDMTNFWGTKSFDLYIIAENLNGEVTSRYLYFDREDREDRGKKIDNYWWVWVLVSIAIVTCIAGGLLYVKKLLKAHRRRSLEQVLMREMHSTEELQTTNLN